MIPQKRPPPPPICKKQSKKGRKSSTQQSPIKIWKLKNKILNLKKASPPPKKKKHRYNTAHPIFGASRPAVRFQGGCFFLIHQSIELRWFLPLVFMGNQPSTNPTNHQVLRSGTASCVPFGQHREGGDWFWAVRWSPLTNSLGNEEGLRFLRYVLRYFLDLPPTPRMQSSPFWMISAKIGNPKDLNLSLPFFTIAGVFGVFASYLKHSGLVEATRKWGPPRWRKMRLTIWDGNFNPSIFEPSLRPYVSWSKIGKHDKCRFVCLNCHPNDGYKDVTFKPHLIFHQTKITKHIFLDDHPGFQKKMPTNIPKWILFNRGLPQICIQDWPFYNSICFLWRDVYWVFVCFYVGTIWTFRCKEIHHAACRNTMGF